MLFNSLKRKGPDKLFIYVCVADLYVMEGRKKKNHIRDLFFSYAVKSEYKVHSGLLRMFTREMSSVVADSEYDITHPAFGHFDRQQGKHHQATLWLQTLSTIMC